MRSSPRSPSLDRRGLAPTDRNCRVAANAAALLLPLVLPLVLLIAPPRLSAEDNYTIRFNWAFLLRTDDGGVSAIDCTPEVVQLKPGDRIRVWLKPLSGCYFYLFLYDAEKVLHLLFPTSFGFWGEPRAVGASYVVPGTDSWFRLDSRSGVEVFYLVLSDHRLRSLEEKTAPKGDNIRAGGTSRVVERPVEVLEEIRRMIVQSSPLVRAAERPVPVAGDFRGLAEETEINGISTEASGIYVRTIRLAH